MAADPDTAANSSPGTRANIASDRLQWMLACIGGPAALTLEDLEAVYDTTGWQGWTLEDELQRFKTDERFVRPLAVSETTLGDWQASVIVTGADGKRWALTCWVDEEAPHRITGSRCVPAPPEGTTVRDATVADAAALTALERRSPLRLGPDGEIAMYFDRGDDYFAAARLMEEVTIYVAEVDGAVAGVYWGAQQPVLVSGVPKKLFLEHHVRIDPETRRGGVFWALVVYGRDRYATTSDSIAFYVSPENHAVRKFVEGTPSWSVQALRALIPCGGAAAAADARRATPDDAEEIVAVLNACHERSELYVPYTVESLTARLERAPEQYTWDNLLLTDGAVVGVAGLPVEVSKVTPDRRDSTRRAPVLDHGFAPGAQQRYTALVHAAGHAAHTSGLTHLAAFTSPGSRTHDTLTSLASEIEPFDFWAFDVEEPAGLATNGLYVDPVCF